MPWPQRERHDDLTLEFMDWIEPSKAQKSAEATGPRACRCFGLLPATCCLLPAAKTTVYYNAVTPPQTPPHRLITRGLEPNCCLCFFQFRWGVIGKSRFQDAQLSFSQGFYREKSLMPLHPGAPGGSGAQKYAVFSLVL